MAFPAEQHAPHIVSHDDCLNLAVAMELECQFIVRAHLWKMLGVGA
jgi:hypothetical protein